MNIAELIRLAQPNDCAAVTACVRQAYMPWVERVCREPAPMIADYARLIAEGSVYVLRDPSADEARGVLVLQRAERTLWIENVAVHPSYQHAGVGRRLLDFAERRAAVGGLNDVQLYTHERMLENIRLYERIGYREVERRQEHGFRRVFMRKEVGSRPTEVRVSHAGDGTGMALIWLDSAMYHAQLNPWRFRVPDSVGLAESFEERAAMPRADDRLDLVAELDGELVGLIFARLEEPMATASRQMVRDVTVRRVIVNALNVRSAFWRLGFGRRLLRSAEAWGRDRGAQLVVLDTYAHSPVSVPFYESGMGYQRKSIVFSKSLESE